MRNTLGCESWFLLLDRENQWQVISCIVNYNLQCSEQRFMNPDLAMKLSVIANNCTSKNNDPCFFLFIGMHWWNFYKETETKLKGQLFREGGIHYKLVFEIHIRTNQSQLLQDEIPTQHCLGQGQSNYKELIEILTDSSTWPILSLLLLFFSFMGLVMDNCSGSWFST